ncbi:hillarin-like [Ruditapes philippinarum]|uniref:hillarin-like n=1 Tax=Ruditapes philippinarum TaxID=129788 RepID=UPI00295B52D0|nr:hillarin-like [Ruditapes philippinarum]
MRSFDYGVAQRQISDRVTPGILKQIMSAPGRLLTTNPVSGKQQSYLFWLRSPTFKYSDKLDCYVDDISALDPDIPGPHPPPTKKAEIFNLDDYIDVDNRAVNTPTKFYRQPLKDLVNYLIAGYDDEMSKIRVIYRWITGQPIDQLPLEKKPAKSHVLFELWRIKNEEKSYAELVSKLCRYADIPCVIIHGTVKGSTYEVGDRIDEVKHFGEWNAVLVDGHWRFINSYWGTVTHDVINPNGDDVIKNGDLPFRLYYLCDDNYFLTDPDQFGTTHLPMCQKWQLRKDPLMQTEFETMAYVKDGYFNLHVQTLTHTQCIIVSDSNQVEIKFTIPQQSSLNIDFKCRLFLLEDGVEKRKDRYVFMHRTNNNNTLTVKIRPPERHVFRFELFGKDVTIKGDIYDYDWIVIYKLIFK